MPDRRFGAAAGAQHASKGCKQMQFQKGQSGNPSGRPPGARNKATLIAEALLQGEAAELTRAAIERAKAGDAAALRMCLDRLAPPSRHRTIEFQLPALTNAQDAVSALAAIATAVAAGELTPSEAGDLSKLIDGFSRLREGTIIERQLAMLERANGKPAPENHQLTQFHQLREINQISRMSQISQDNHGGES
jgi:hypothetical protein